MAMDSEALNEQLEWFEGIPKGRWSESMIHFVVAMSIRFLSSPKYASACPGRMEATRYLPLQSFW